MTLILKTACKKTFHDSIEGNIEDKSRFLSSL